MSLGYNPARVQFVDRAEVVLGVAQGRTLSALTWERTLGDVSQCAIEVAQTSPLLLDLEPWVHHVLVWCGPELVWRGPVYNVSVARNAVSITARDPSVYFDKRRIANRRVWWQQDLADIARDLARDAMADDDPFKLINRLAWAATEIYATRDAFPDARMIADEFKDLSDAGLLWTVLAGRLLLGPVTKSYETRPITDRDIDGELSILKDGGDTVTDAWVIGKNVTGRWVQPAEEVGLLQTIDKQDAITDGETAMNAARKIVQSGKTTPRRIEFPSDTRLLPSAPVALNELIPGAIIPFATTALGVEITSNMMLEAVKVSQTAGGETVSVTLVDPPAEVDPQHLAAPDAGFGEHSDDNPTYVELR